MKEIRIKNIRRFKDSGSIKLNGITLLLGCNSSGKSTIARMLPILKQSVNTATRSPILWNGDLVDWGDYEGIQKTDGDIEIGLSLDTTNSDSHSSPYYYGERNDTKEMTWKVDITLTKKGNNHYCSKVSIDTGDFEISYKINDNSDVTSLTIDGEDVETKDAKALRNDKHIMPSCMLTQGSIDHLPLYYRAPHR